MWLWRLWPREKLTVIEAWWYLPIHCTWLIHIRLNVEETTAQWVFTWRNIWSHLLAFLCLIDIWIFNVVLSFLFLSISAGFCSSCLWTKLPFSCLLSSSVIESRPFSFSSFLSGSQEISFIFISLWLSLGEDVYGLYFLSEVDSFLLEEASWIYYSFFRLCLVFV